MKEINIRLSGSYAEINAESYKKVSVEIFDVDKDDIISNLSIEDVLQYFGVSEILEKIGEDECKEYFHLIERY